MSDYFGRVLGRTFATPAITPRVRARFEPERAGSTDAGAQALSAEIEADVEASVPGADAEPAPAGSAAPPRSRSDAERPGRVGDDHHASGSPEVRSELADIDVEVDRGTIAQPSDAVARGDQRVAPRSLEDSELDTSERDDGVIEDGSRAQGIERPQSVRREEQRPRDRAESRREVEIARPMPAQGIASRAPGETQIIERSSVRVTIGHLEIRATGAEKKEKEKKATPKAMLTLDDYVRERKEGRR